MVACLCKNEFSIIPDKNVNADIYCSNNDFIKIIEQNDLRNKLLNEYKKDCLILESLGKKQNDIYRDNKVEVFNFIGDEGGLGFYAKI